MREATLAILDANVITLNPKQPKAQAIAIEDDIVVAVGSNKKIRNYIDKRTRVINANNRAVLPGFTDCHAHMTGYGLLLQRLDLRTADSIRDMQKKLLEYANRNPEKSWILGRRWDQEKLQEKRYPSRWDLDTVVADRPVLLVRVCGHIGVANSKALQLANITRNTAVEGGEVDRDTKTGEPNGILKENALELVYKKIPKPNPEELEEAARSACKKAVQAGLTCVHWMVESIDEIHAIRKLSSHGKLPLQVYLGISVNLLDELTNLGLLTDLGSDKVKIGFVKILADGSLGARTAALEKPYSDSPTTRGMMLYTQKELDHLISKAHQAGLQLAVHAIGDRAVKLVTRAFGKALKQFPRENHRHRIEHCSVLNLALIKRMKSLGLMASVQPHFVISDSWIVDRVGKKRIRWAYPFKTLMETGLTVASGSDCPVEDIDPLLGIWACTERVDTPEERLTVEDAIKTYTVNAAYASFDEVKKGTIEVGKRADFTFLSKDPMRISRNRIRTLRIEMVLVGGRTVYSRRQIKN